MDLFKLTTKIKFNTIERDRLFFDQYEYSLCFRLSDCGALRECSEAGVLRSIEWRNDHRSSWSRNSKITSEQTNHLLEMWHLLQEHKHAIKPTFSFNLVYLYGNDPELLEYIAVKPYTRMRYGQQAMITRPRDVVLLQEPKFKLRSYFKERGLDSHQMGLLRNFLIAREGTYGFSKAFKNHLEDNKWFYLQRHHWVEHNDPADLTMLSLVIPGLIRKTLPVQAK